MKINYIAFILDGLFVFIGGFILSFCVLYYLIPYPYSIIVSLSLSGLLLVLALKILNSKQNKTNLFRKDKKLYTDTIIRLNLMDEQKLIELFQNAVCPNATIKPLSRGFLCEQTDTAYLISFGFNKVKKSDVVRAFNLPNAKKAVFFAENFEKEVIDFASRFNGKITLYDGKDCFNFLKEKELLPTEDFSQYYSQNAKPIFKKQILDKKNAKKFLLFGVVFSFFSFLVPYKLYYLICGGLMISFSLYLKLFGKSQE